MVSGLDVQALCMEVEKMFQLFNCSAHEVPGVVGSYISLLSSYPRDTLNQNGKNWPCSF